MGKHSALSPLLLLGGALLGYSVLRQGQNTAATLTTGRMAGFQPKKLRGTYLDCEATVRFTNTHPTRPTNLQRLSLNVQSAQGVIFATAHLPAGQAPLAPGTTTDVRLPVTVELMPLLLQVVNLTNIPTLLKSFTSVGSVITWLTTKAGLRDVVLEGQALIDGLVVPLPVQTVNLGLFAPVSKTAPKATATSRRRALTNQVTA